MNLKSIRCRDHGGTFEIPAVRGRPPVRCGGKYPSCSSVAQNGGRKRRNDVVTRENTYSAAEKAASVSRPERVASEIKNRKMSLTAKCGKVCASTAARDRHETRCKACALVYAGRTPDPVPPMVEPVPNASANGARKATQPRSQANPCVDMAYKSRELLESLGWVVAVKGWTDHESMETYATLTASRDTELMTLVWQGGKLTDQQYSIWDTEVPSANGKPKTDISYLPEFDEMTDREIVQRLSGMAVEWWNRIGQSVERAVIPGKLQIEHVYSGSGDETPADRVIKFIDHNGTGFRAFRLGALMKVGKGK